MDDVERQKRINDFFSEYAAGFNNALADAPKADVEATAGAFADCFVEASPSGVSCGKNDEQFRAQIPQGYAFYRSIGTRSMRIAALSATPLDGCHSMVNVGWEGLYERKDGSEELIAFDVIYLVQEIDNQPKIFAYITGDEQKVLRERGLIQE